MYTIAVVMLFSSCKGKKTYTTDDGNTKVTYDVSEVEDASKEMNAKMEELKKLSPMTADQIKLMLPEELLGMKRTNFSANSMMGYASGEATYLKNDSAQLRLTIFDCAGEAGSAFYMMNYWSKMSMESQTDDGYVKTIEFMGGKAVEDYKKYNNSYTITFSANDRLMINLSGENMSRGELEDAAKALNLKVNG